MAIRDRSELDREKIKIDLAGPAGNVFYLLKLAKELYKKMGRHPDEFEVFYEHITKYCDYEMVIELFDQEFGDFVDLYR